MNTICLLGSHTDKSIDEACSSFDLVYYIDEFEFTNYIDLFSRKKLNQYSNLVIYKDFPEIIPIFDDYEPDIKFNSISVTRELSIKYPQETTDFFRHRMK